MQHIIDGTEIQMIRDELGGRNSWNKFDSFHDAPDHESKAAHTRCYNFELFYSNAIVTRVLDDANKQLTRAQHDDAIDAPLQF